MSRVGNFYKRTAEVVTTVVKPRFEVPGWLKAIGGFLLKLVLRVTFAIIMMVILYVITGSYWIVF